MNKVILFGRLAADPELKTIESGRAVAKFNFATNESWVDKNSGQRQEKTEWHKIVVWGPQAENVAKYLCKGRQALVEGKISTREWETAEGERRWTTEIVANNVQFVSDKQQSQSRNERAAENNTDTDDLPF